MRNILRYNWPIIFIIIGSLIILLSACMSEQKIVQRSIMKVLTTKPAFDTVGRLFVDLHPCANDTVFKTHSDTTEAHDTTYTNYWDTINHTDTVRQTITKRITIHDTATIVDRQKEKLDAELIQRLYREASGLNATISDRSAQIVLSNSSKHKWMWAAIGTWIAILAGVVLWVYSRIKVKV